MSSKRSRDERYSSSNNQNQGFDMNNIMNMLGGLGGLGGLGLGNLGKGSSSRNNSHFNSDSIDFKGNVSIEVENFMKALLPLMRSGYAKEIQHFVTLLEDENIKRSENIDKNE
ncbi:MAG: hypothetical protein FWC47_13910 [Oscillospiraceae bacterium]|nr:hypothetical protein [Oscillospiraceae bacterium]